MGLQDRRKPYPQPDFLWGILKLLAARGEIAWKDGATLADFGF